MKENLRVELAIKGHTFEGFIEDATPPSIKVAMTGTLVEVIMPGNGVLELRIKASDPGAMTFITPDRPEDTAAGILPVRVRLDSPSARYLMGLRIGSEVTIEAEMPL